MLMLAQVAATTLDDVALLLRVVIGIQIVTAIALVLAHRKIAKNQVAMADLLKQAAAKIEGGAGGPGD